MPKKPNGKKNNTTRYTGVYATGNERSWKIRATATHPVTGRTVARTKTVSDMSAREASARREVLLEQLYAELEAEQTSPEGPLTTFADYVEQWVREKATKVRPSVLAAYMDILGKRVLPVLGHFPMLELRRSDIIRWVAWAERQVSSRGQLYAQDTMHGWWRVLACCVRDMAAEFDLPDPTRRVTPPKSSVRGVTEGRALSAEQLAELLASVQRYFPDWYPEVSLLAFTGMRPSELYALTWEDVDFEARKITQRRSVSRLRVVNEPKTGAGRDIALTEQMTTVLEGHRQRLVREEHPGLEAGIVFPSVKGGYRTNAALRKTLRLCTGVAGIPIKVGPKTLRKTWITLAALAGHDRLAIRSNVGHSSEELTERYAWVSIDEKRRVVEGIEALTGGQG